ncbi:MAG: S9 family peptidase, partial [Myxococcota bacterium]
MVRSISRTLTLAATLAIAGCAAAPDGPMTPPPESPAPSASTRVLAGPPLARREDLVETLHGVEVADPYRWLEDEKSEEVQTFLRNHNRYTRSVLDAVPGRAKLVERLKALSYVEEVSSPRRRGNRYFFSRRHADKEKNVYYWREGETGEPKVLIDPNLLSEDGSTS